MGTWRSEALSLLQPVGIYSSIKEVLQQLLRNQRGSGLLPPSTCDSGQQSGRGAQSKTCNWQGSLSWSPAQALQPVLHVGGNATLHPMVPPPPVRGEVAPLLPWDERGMKSVQCLSLLETPLVYEVYPMAGCLFCCMISPICSFVIPKAILQQRGAQTCTKVLIHRLAPT